MPATHATRWTRYGCGVVIAAAACSAAPLAHAQAAANPGPAAQDRLTILAQRFAGPGEASAAVPANPSAPAPSSSGSVGPAPAPRPAAPDWRLPARERQPLGSPEPAPGEALVPAGGTDAGGSGAWVLGTLTALGVVIGLILLLRVAVTRMGFRSAVRSSPVVEVLSRSCVAPRSHVVLLRVGERVLIVSDSSSGMRTLGEVTDADEVARLLQAVTAARPESISASFSQLVHGFSGQFDPDAEGPGGEHALGRARDSLAGLLSRMRVAGSGGKR